MRGRGATAERIRQGRLCPLLGAQGESDWPAWRGLVGENRWEGPWHDRAPKPSRHLSALGVTQVRWRGRARSLQDP